MSGSKNLAAAAVLPVLLLAACGGGTPVSTDESGGALASMIHTADPAAARQLVSGWHPIERNAWRWTAGRFSVALRPPPGASQSGAVLLLKFSIPDPVFAQVKEMTLGADIDGVKLAPEKFGRAGGHSFSREVDAKLLARDTVTVSFALDRFLAPSEADRRELGVVVSAVGFEAR
jgi:hypothetical protein